MYDVEWQPLEYQLVVTEREKKRKKFPGAEMDGQQLLWHLCSKMIKKKDRLDPGFEPRWYLHHAKFKALQGLEPLSDRHTIRPIRFLHCAP